LQTQPASATPSPTFAPAGSNDSSRQDDVGLKSKQAFSKATHAAVADSTEVVTQPQILGDRDPSVELAAAPHDSSAMKEPVADLTRSVSMIPKTPALAEMEQADARPEMRQKIAGRDLQQASAVADLQLVITCRDLDDLTRAAVALGRVAVAGRYTVSDVRGLSKVAGSAPTSPADRTDRKQQRIERVVHLPKSRVVGLLQSLDRDDEGNRRQVELSAGPLVHARGWDNAYGLVAMIAPESADGQIVAKASAAREQHDVDLSAAATRSSKVKEAVAKKNESVEIEKPSTIGAIERMLNDVGVPLSIGPRADRPDSGLGMVAREQSPSKNRERLSAVDDDAEERATTEHDSVDDGVRLASKPHMISRRAGRGVVESSERGRAIRDDIVEQKLSAVPLPRPVDPIVAVRIVLTAPVTAPPPGQPGHLAPR